MPKGLNNINNCLSSFFRCGNVKGQYTATAVKHGNNFNIQPQPIAFGRMGGASPTQLAAVVMIVLLMIMPYRLTINRPHRVSTQ